MKTINALAVRKGFGRILDGLEKTRKPVCVTRGRKPVAALIPYETFRERFADFLSRDAVEDAIRALERFRSDAASEDSLTLLAELRDGRPV